VAQVIREELAFIDTHAMYPGTVFGYERSNDVDYVDVRLDDPKFGKGIAGVPIRPGVPGTLVEVPNGARVLVGFTNGKRSQPIAHLWDRAVPTKIMFEAGTEVTIEATTVKLGDGAMLGVARLGDTAGPYLITSASTKVKAG
jgi:hypothetical protein